MRKSKRILSLSGGGIRGIYQISYLKKLFELGRPNEDESNSCSQYFDFISGTSTGAIIAMAIALDIDLQKVYDFYITKGKSIFTKRYVMLNGFIKKSLYNEGKLKNALVEVFQDKKLGEARTPIIITSSQVGQAKIKIFKSYSNEDKNIKVVDVLMSSTAAPTYFPSHTIPSGQISYFDGGLWSNSPGNIALVTALKELNFTLEDIHFLQIGTSSYKPLNTRSAFNRMRLYSILTPKKIIDLFFSTQEDYDRHLVEQMIKPELYVKIDSEISEKIDLDDYNKAILHLPQLAESKALSSIEKVRKLFFDIEDFSNALYQNPTANSFIQSNLIFDTGLIGFYPSRDKYRYRNARELHEYIGLAKHSIKLVSISFSGGDDFEKVLKVLKNKLSNKDFIVTISLLNPYHEYLLKSVSQVFNKNEDSLKGSIIHNANALIKFKNSLSSEQKNNCILRYHNSIPFGSAILLDEDFIEGKIHIETKPYKTRTPKSFAFEIMPVLKEGLFDSIKEGYSRLIQEGDTMIIKTEDLSKVTLKPNKNSPQNTVKRKK